MIKSQIKKNSHALKQHRGPNSLHFCYQPAHKISHLQEGKELFYPTVTCEYILIPMHGNIMDTRIKENLQASR
jgi:hypothetical protein